MKKVKLIITAAASALALLAAPANAFWLGWGAEPEVATVYITVTSPEAPNIELGEQAPDAKPEMVTYCYKSGAPYGKSDKYPDGKPVVKGSKDEEALKKSAHKLVPCKELAKK